MLKENINSRTKKLLGSNFNKISKLKIAVCGVGGVGSIIPLAFVRSGVCDFLLIDFDKVNESNLNRQLAYDFSDIGMYKVDAVSNKIKSINSKSKCKLIKDKIDEKFNFKIFDKYDYVFDCIDYLPGKVSLIKYCLLHNIRIISSMGMGNKITSYNTIITKLNKTTSDPLARKLRFLLKKEGVDISKLFVSFSSEIPIKSDKIISSMVFTPNSAGLAMSSFVVDKIIKGEEWL